MPTNDVLYVLKDHPTRSCVKCRHFKYPATATSVFEGICMHPDVRAKRDTSGSYHFPLASGERAEQSFTYTEDGDIASYQEGGRCRRIALYWEKKDSFLIICLRWLTDFFIAYIKPALIWFIEKCLVRPLEAIERWSNKRKARRFAEVLRLANARRAAMHRPNQLIMPAFIDEDEEF